ncbi:hypothetical protein A0J61_09716 [Choanephora cucurbitarum]|uniref:Uncharacterized protein n=1 Tax=Choanephora cucurbitarum TaxID=101091 RepID=A0A1C7N4J6_9FUNG|nr:hypothetical protein A0J61_09716 [Choanephora cucurbitarum]
MELPSVLTHKGGMLKAVAELLRPCIENSLKTFSNSEDRKQYASYVPSSTYIRTLLNTNASSNNQRSLDSFVHGPFELDTLMKDLVTEATTEAISIDGSATIEVASDQEGVDNLSDSNHTVSESKIDIAFKRVFDENTNMVNKDSFKRRVPSSYELLPSLESSFLSFGPLKCSKSARTLFDNLAWKQALSILKTVKLDYASDLLGVQLYYKTGMRDKFWLDLV